MNRFLGLEKNLHLPLFQKYFNYSNEWQSQSAILFVREIKKTRQ